MERSEWNSELTLKGNRFPLLPLQSPFVFRDATLNLDCVTVGAFPPCETPGRIGCIEVKRKRETEETGERETR